MGSMILVLWIRPRELGNMWSNSPATKRPDQGIVRGVAMGVSDLGGILHRIKNNIVSSFDEDEADRYE